jgi:hypothetical protein
MEGTVQQMVVVTISPYHAALFCVLKAMRMRKKKKGGFGTFRPVWPNISKTLFIYF